MEKKDHLYVAPEFIADKLAAIDTALWTLVYCLFEHQPAAINTYLKGLDRTLAGDTMPSEGAHKFLQDFRDAIARSAKLPDLH